MKKVKVHVANEYDFMDSRVAIDILLPATPRKGETLYLKDEQLRELEKQACQNLNIASLYYPKWFYGHSYNCDDPKESNLKDLGFDDAIFISSVAYNADEDIIYIEIDSIGGN